MSKEEFRSLVRGALSGSESERVARRLGWVTEDHHSQADPSDVGNPDADAPRPRATDPSQGRGNPNDVGHSPQHAFRELIEESMAPRGIFGRGQNPNRVFGPENN